MPQLHLPMFPTGVTHITSELAFERKDGCITYFNGHMPVFTHGEKDVATFRMITSQFCVSGYAKQSDIIRALPIASVLGEIGAAAIGGQPDAKQGRLDGGGEALLRRLDREGLSDMAEALIEPNNGVSRLRDGGLWRSPVSS